MVKKLACFFTGGYTEASGYMQIFLKKINNRYEYEQCMPNSTRKRKGSPKKLIDEYNGITGEALISKVYEYLKTPVVMQKFNSGVFSGILIEDDLDGRFDRLSPKEIEKYENSIRKNISEILGKNYPVYFVYASPEIESWFASDWDGGFGNFFCNGIEFRRFDKNLRRYFSILLRKRIEFDLLEGCRSIERYTYANGQYRKLSRDIDNTIAEINIIIDNTDTSAHIADNRSGFHYSKNEHGSRILRDINPDKVREKCTEYFARCYLALANENG